ncbi:MAG: hypothetical protein AAFV01_17770, partial [Bacteroidota bacterium]
QVPADSTDAEPPEEAVLESLVDEDVSGDPTVLLEALLAVDRGVDDFDTSVRGGLEIRPVEVLAVRAGFTTAPARISLGAGVDLSRAHAALAFENHEALGWTPAIDLLVRF